MNTARKALKGPRGQKGAGLLHALGLLFHGYGLKAAVVSAFFMSAVVFGASVPWASDEPPQEPSVRYGTYCLGHYGGMQKGASIKGAIASLRLFFEKRGLSVKVLDHDMRFIRADIYNGTALVDSVVLDARTGKMRSIY